MIASPCSRDQFIEAISDDEHDKFAKSYFRPNADKDKQWHGCIGAWEGDKLCGAVVVTASGKVNRVANLHLLHTFAAHKGKGVGTFLVNAAFDWAKEDGSVYFRVSANPNATLFYEKCGFKYWGNQKSGCSLSMFKIKGNKISDGLYDENDPVIKKALWSGRMGGLVESYTKPEDISTLEDFL